MSQNETARRAGFAFFFDPSIALANNLNRSGFFTRFCKTRRPPSCSRFTREGDFTFRPPAGPHRRVYSRRYTPARRRAHEFTAQPRRYRETPEGGGLSALWAARGTGATFELVAGKSDNRAGVLARQRAGARGRLLGSARFELSPRPNRPSWCFDPGMRCPKMPAGDTSGRRGPVAQDF